MIVPDLHVTGPLWQQKIYYYGKKWKQTETEIHAKRCDTLSQSEELET